MYDGSIGGVGPCSVGIGSSWEEGGIGEVKIVPENVELEAGVGCDIWYPCTPRTIEAWLL